jgi:hypothetical protein
MRENKALEDEIEEYGDPGISSKDAPVPRWLIFTYCILPIWGFFWLYMYWNGAHGWIDRGYWHELEIAANTTFPHKNMDNPQKENAER